MTEKDKMLMGQLYDPSDPILTAERHKARIICQQFNSMNEEAKEERNKLLFGLFGEAEIDFCIVPPFYCDYGYNIKFGRDVFMNFNCCILDVMEVKIGNNVLIGPNVQIYTATHPLEIEARNLMLEFAKPVTIGNDVWIGGGAIICPGATIGNGVVIAAGSVVTKNVVDNVLIAGNPAREIRKINN
jgi:maltose O-acetyltransferase